MYPDIQHCKTQYTHGHNTSREPEFTVNYYKSHDGPALDVPPPDYFFATKLIGDTYIHYPTGVAVPQMWVRDMGYQWKRVESGVSHPYLSPAGSYEPYVLNIREGDQYATWIVGNTKKEYERKRAKKDDVASEYYIAGLRAGESSAGGQPSSVGTSRWFW
ncbi:unnamed protein product [Peniophora sp. CBMAI 1063]|nr:unnamed protein product [Peniophora sp. CBMAI 1063]